jgi:hypothetical protein
VTSLQTKMERALAKSLKEFDRGVERLATPNLTQREMESPEFRKLFAKNLRDQK